MIEILIIVALLVVATAVVALFAYITHRRRNLSSDVDFVRSMLPGVDCGMCGEKNCTDFAKAVLEGSKEPDACPLLKPSSSEKIREYFKPRHPHSAKVVAFVKCKGGNRAEETFKYEGAHNCAIQERLHSGCKACKYACLGCGDCVKACRYNAMYINDRGTAEVIRGKCTGCGACVKACPNNLISMTKLSLSVGVVCNNQSSEPGIEKKCKVGCTHCGSCISACPADAIKIVNNVPVIDPEKCIECYKCVMVCPNHCISRL